MAVNVCSCSVILSPNKKSILGFGMGSPILYFILFVGFLVSMSSADTEMTCVNVKNIFEKKGMLTMIDLQEQANSELTAADNPICGWERGEGGKL
ncbi:unnamed protein product [Leptidea sinapis]|uniref:Uncharacterized protein n=1 Tax=Leptidea sinapis TaxID=189913 RepID=A0A5E4QT80_9NEOP|nr:unnamed protein product [Leptidea sinapis]